MEVESEAGLPYGAPYMAKKTLVTGGAGFIGSHFVRKLFRETDDDILVLDAFTYAASPGNIPDEILSSPRFELVRGSVVNETVVDKLISRVDSVVHFAAESHVARSLFSDRLFYETDVLGTHSVIAAASRNLGSLERLVHISTSEVYGSAVRAPMDEDHPLLPCTPYASAKAGADMAVYSYGVSYGIPAVRIRPFNNYGPRQHPEKVIPRFITQALLGEPLTVHGEGDATRDWVWVEDTCEAIMRALVARRGGGEVYNVGTGVEVSIREVAERVRALVPGAGPIVHVPERPGQVRRHVAGTSKAKVGLGFEAEVSFEDGLKRTVEWYAANRDWWKGLLAEREVSANDHSRRVSGSF